MRPSSSEEYELLSPELVLVDPELRRRLLSQPSRVATTIRASSTPPIHRPHGLRLAVPVQPSPRPIREAPVERHASLARRCLPVAAPSVTAVMVMILAQTISFGSHRPGAAPTAPTAPLAASPQTVTVVPYTPPPTPVKLLSAADERRLAALLRQPMRDPFAPATK